MEITQIQINVNNKKFDQVKDSNLSLTMNNFFYGTIDYPSFILI